MARLILGTFLLVGCALLAASQETAAPVEVPAEAMQALLIRRVAPVYPPLARQARIQGTVVMKVIVNKAGEVRAAEPISGHPMLAPSAIEAVKQWRYTPYLKDGEPVEVTTAITSVSTFVPVTCSTWRETPRPSVSRKPSSLLTPI